MAKAIRYTISVTAILVLDDDAQDCTTEDARPTGRERSRLEGKMNAALDQATDCQCSAEILETDVIDVELSPMHQRVMWDKLPAEVVR
jgi:hypothetical protein